MSSPLRLFSPLLLLLAAGQPLSATEADSEFVWHEVCAAQMEGQGWSDTKKPFDRLPARAEGLVRPPVWELSQHSAGLNFRFTTNASSIYARWTVSSDRLAMSHMPATGVSGVDLYVRRGDHWHFLAVGRATEFPKNELPLITDLIGESAEYRMYLPLYNGVTQIAVGVPTGCSFQMVEPSEPKTPPVVIYGTSITHGGCASRPGMSYPAILGRRLNVPIINLGFSGNGKAEAEVAALLAELNPAAFVLDPIPNLTAENVRDLMPNFIGILRAKHPKTPILLVESPTYPDTSFVAPRAQRVADSNKYLREAYEVRRASGDHWISIVPGCDLSVDGGDATVDGVHPTDLGFVRMADVIEPHLRAVLD